MTDSARPPELSVWLLAAPDDERALALSWTIHNASLTVLLTDGRRISLSSFNALGHLERPGLEGLITYR